MYIINIELKYLLFIINNRDFFIEHYIKKYILIYLMNNKFDIKEFTNLQYHPECLNLDMDDYSIIFNSSPEVKNKKKIQKKTITVLKNPKLKIIKDKISNKINLILNKLTENNINNLVIEFINSIYIYNINDYNEFIKTIYLKMISEINFFKIYISFFQIITNIYNNVYNYNIDYLYHLLENKFMSDYTDIKLDDSFSFLKEINDDKRTNNLILINELINFGYLKTDIKEHINEIILQQTKYLADIHFWFKSTSLSTSQHEYIKLLTQNEEIQLRDKILLNNLLVVPDPKQTKIIYKINENKPITTNNIELDNLLEEYLFINNYESLEHHINTNCMDANSKNKFSEYIIIKYFKINEPFKILNLLKALIKKKILFKSNLSRGLLNLYNSKLLQINENLKHLLIFFKNIGITKGIEHLMDKFNIVM